MSSSRSQLVNANQHRIPQIPDFIAEKFREECEVELTPAEQRIASRFISRAMEVLRGLKNGELATVTRGRNMRHLLSHSMCDDESQYE